MGKRKAKDGRGGFRPGAGRKPTLRDPVSFTLEIEGADMKALDEIAAERSTSIAATVREAIKSYLARRRSR